MRGAVRPRAGPRASTPEFNESDEAALTQHLLALDADWFPLSLKTVIDAANHLRSTKQLPPVGKSWARRFLQRSLSLNARAARSKDRQRKLRKSPTTMSAWFRTLSNLYTDNNIQAGDIYNMDEAGFLLSYVGLYPLVMDTEEAGTKGPQQPTDAEWASAIVCICGDGSHVPPFILLEGDAEEDHSELPDGWVLKPTKGGCTDSATAIDWIKHFHRHTEAQSEGRHRVLILDGHESHLSIPFRRFCAAHKIILFHLPSRSLHLLQPLEVYVFSMLRHYCHREIKKPWTENAADVSRIEFLIAMHRAFKKSMTPLKVFLSFRDSGIFPVGPHRLLPKIAFLPPMLPPVEDETLSDHWHSRSPRNAQEANSQADLIIAHLQKNGESPLVEALTKLSEYHASVSSRLKLVEDITARARAKEERTRRNRRRLRLLGSDTLSGYEIKAMVAPPWDSEGQSRKDSTENILHCTSCDELGHTSEVCEEAPETSETALGNQEGNADLDNSSS